MPRSADALAAPRSAPPAGLVHSSVTFLRRVVSLDVDPRKHGDVTKESTMRVFVAGASGAIGSRLVPPLIERGHEVIGTSRSSERVERVLALGAEARQLDLLDEAAVRRAVLETEPEAIVHQATALANAEFSRNFDRAFAQTNRLRTAGTDALLAAARAAGVPRLVAQSYASGRYIREGGRVKSERDPLDSAPVPHHARELRGDAAARRGRHGRRRRRAALRRLLRRGG